MPDEALKASLQGRPRQAPDFSPLALSHLHSSCLAVRQLVKQYLSAPSATQLESLSIAVKDIHHTLQLLDRHGALLVTSELSLLLDAMENGTINDSAACAHSLVFAGERLADYVAHLQRPGAIDSALPLLPVINDCRACRGEELLSEMLVVASGIDLPDASNLQLPSPAEVGAFVKSIKASRKPLMSGLIGWFTDESELQSSLSELITVFANLSRHCDAPTSLRPLVPLFDSAEFICHSVKRGGLDNNAALHTLFAQLERLLDSYSKLDHHDRAAFAKPVPERLFLNMLYYVALSSESSAKAVALRRRFRLDRFVPRAMSTDHSQVVFDGVGDRLADSIRDAIERETETAREWLNDEQRTTNDLYRVHDRLAQLEPAITLLGAPESLRQLQLITSSLNQLIETGSDLKPKTTERTADALVRLERALDTELNAVRVRKTDTHHSDLESILTACLTEAQFRLLEIEDDLIVLFGDASEPAISARKSTKVAAVNAKLSMINSALQVLPLPEVSPLISGVQSIVTRHENKELSTGARRDLATVMVSLGYYLNSVLQPNGAAGQLLLEAEEALLQLDIEGLESNDDTLSDARFDVNRLLASGTTAGVGVNALASIKSGSDSNADDHKQGRGTANLDETFVDYTLDTEAESFIDVSLEQMGVINSTLFDYEQARVSSRTKLRSTHRDTLVSAYTTLAREANATGSTDLAELANANIRLLHSGNESSNTHVLLEESVAVLPQLINQMHSSSDKVYGLQELLDQLTDAALDDITLAMDVNGILELNSTGDNSTENLALTKEAFGEEGLGESISEDAIEDAFNEQGLSEQPLSDADIPNHTNTVALNYDEELDTTVGFDPTGLNAATAGISPNNLDATNFDATRLDLGDEELSNHDLGDLNLTTVDPTIIDPAAIDLTTLDPTTLDPTIGFDSTIGIDPTSVISDTIAFDKTEILAQNVDAELADNDRTSDDTRDGFPVMTLDNTLEQVFFRECDQHMLSLRKSLGDALNSNDWEGDTERAALNFASQKAGVDSPAISPALALPNKDMLRALHTLTGSAQTVDAQGIIAIAQPLQKAALLKQRNGNSFDRAETQYISELLDVLQARLDAMEAGVAFNDDNDAVIAQLQNFVTRSEPWMPERQSGLAVSSNVGSVESVFEQEARELLESLRTESLRLSDNAQRDDAVEQILRRLHTIKGSARMAGQVALADRAHLLEDEISSVGAGSGMQLDDAIFNGLGELQTLMLVETPSVPAPVAPKSVSESARSEPMGLTEASFEQMLSLATRATVSQTKLGESILRLREACSDIESSSQRLQRLPHEQGDLNSAAVAEMLNDLNNAQRMLADALLDAEAEHTQGSRANSSLHQTLIRAQLVSFAESQPRLSHAATDAAKETGKQVVFDLKGGELNIDKATHRKLMIPLEHLIRNAVVHGIEADVEREASGKPTQGIVSVDAKIDGTDLLIEVSDDGAGISPESLFSNKAMKLVPQNLSTDRILAILCESGFTTHQSPDQLSGRGLGLSTVKQLVDELDGTLQLSLPAQGGSVFSIRVPQKIRINQVVLVEHHSRSYAIPINFVHTVSDEDCDLSAADIQFNGNDYSLCSLDAIVNGDIASSVNNVGRRVILIGVHNKHIALLVDSVVGYREVIAQPLGAQFANLKRYMGGAILANGRQVLIPDFNRLLRPENELPVPNWGAANAPVLNKTALVIDDSITMRIAAEQMLQSLNIEPSLARDGAEAVELVSESLPDVLLVDIDMPRMNGFDFLKHLAVLHPSHSVPIIMISTRDTDADREQASALGAGHYLVKPYTEEQMQTTLLEAGVIELVL